MASAPPVVKADRAVNAATGAAPPGATRCFDSSPTFVPPPPYRSAPWFLILRDLGVIFTQLPYLPYVFLPLNLSQGGILEDMTIGGLIYQIVAVMITLAILPVAFMSFFTGFPGPVLLVTGTLSVIWLLYFVQGPSTILPVDPRLTAHYPNETWFFINGICTTTSGHKKVLKRLKELFNRDVIGINNKSLGKREYEQWINRKKANKVTDEGIIGDLLECLVQRDLRWLTSDIRLGYANIQSAVENPNNERIVLLCHSQGCIEMSEIVDQLLNDYPATKLNRIEVYTFASAANHFSAPLDRQGNSPFRAVEHFANTNEMVSRFGVLSFVSQDQIQLPKGSSGTGTSALPQTCSRFAGRVFVREASGHMLCSHYLGKDNILDTPAAQSNSRLVQYRGGKTPPL